MMKPQRKLVAIMFSDIAGYTSMMQEDEEQGLKVISHFREILDNLVQRHDGEIIQFYGDGSLCIFNSTISALECAIEVQAQSRNQPAIPLRIGLHLGDIVKYEDSIYGDGVNIASRIESIGIPGAILFSERMVPDIKSHPDLTYSSIGNHHFKNIKSEMEVFALTNDGLSIPDPIKLVGKLEGNELPSSENMAELGNDTLLPNDILIDLICERLAKKNEALDLELNEANLDVQKIKVHIINCFPSPIAERLNSLFNNRILAEFNSVRFSALVQTYQSIVQFLAYIMSSQLWDEMILNENFKISDDLSDLLVQHFNTADVSDNTPIDYVDILIKLTDAFDLNSVNYFIEELTELKVEALSNPKLHKAYQFFLTWSANPNEQLLAEQTQSLCLLAEEHLGSILNEFSFLVDYKMISVREIQKSNRQNLMAKYPNRKEDSQANSQQSEVLLFKMGEHKMDEYLNISPFLIYHFMDEASAILYTFNMEKLDGYQYLHTSDDQYEMIQNSKELDRFKLNVLNLLPKDDDLNLSDRKPSSRFLKNKN